MGTYDVYLEIGSTGRCMAHVPSLPGCFVSAAGRDEALARLPGAILDYVTWLAGHEGTPGQPGEVNLEVVEEHNEAGPFDPGDRAALFAADNLAMTAAEVEQYLALASYNRADLIAALGHLPREVLNWKPATEEMTVEEVLRHIGRAERYYLSRILGPDTLQEAWAGTEEMPVFDFLTMARRDVAAGFGGLDEGQRAASFHPERDEPGPLEPWTARKALRRLLEHEREHLAHIGDMLAAWRYHFLARTAAERSALIWQLTNLERDTLTKLPVFDNVTARDLLAHVATWDAWHTERIVQAVAGEDDNIGDLDLEAQNARLLAEHKTWSLEQSLEALAQARQAFYDVLDGIGDGDLHREVTLPWQTRQERSRKQPLTRYLRWRYRHEASHSQDLARWRLALNLPKVACPQPVLMAALETGRDEMITTAALVPESERETLPVCGVWMVKDVLGHVADWEWYGVEGLEGGASRRSLDIPYEGDIQAWNEQHAAARLHQPWEQVLSDFEAARERLRTILSRIDDGDLVQPFPAPWNPEWTVFRWIHLWLEHEREHAAGIRAELGAPGFPERLTVL